MGSNIKYNLSLCQQRGLSLIELMIAIPLGVLVMFAILQIFTANVRGVGIQSAFSRVQENGRMSMELMTRDIRGADYWGCTQSITNNLDTTDGDYNPNWQQGIAGEDDVAAATVIAGIDVKEDTDTLTLRSAQAIPNVNITATVVENDVDFFITINSGIEQGAMLLIADCEVANLFTVTNANADTGTIVHNQGEPNVLGSVQNAIKDLSKSYEINAQLFAVNFKTYFIGENSAASYSLYRSDNSSAEELVRGVNDLQLMYGEDTSGNGSVDTYSNASAITNMDDVLSVRLKLVSESGNGASGSSLERTYTVTANIRNRTL